MITSSTYSKLVHREDRFFSVEYLHMFTNLDVEAPKILSRLDLYRSMAFYACLSVYRHHVQVLEL